MVEVDGKLVRACAVNATPGMVVNSQSAKAQAAQREAFDRILGNHLLYCTVCDNNNGNCTVHNTTKLLGVEHQAIPFRTKPYEVDSTNPFIAMIPTNAFFAVAASRPAKTLRSTRPCPFAGKIRTLVCSGMAVPRLANPAASPAAIASPSVPAMR